MVKQGEMGKKDQTVREQCLRTILEIASEWPESKRGQRVFVVYMAFCKAALKTGLRPDAKLFATDITDEVDAIIGRRWVQGISQSESVRVNRQWSKFENHEFPPGKAQGLIQGLLDAGFEEYPVFVKNAGGGAGQLTYYSVEWRKIRDRKDLNYILGATEPIRNFPIPEGGLKYICEDLKSWRRWLLVGWKFQAIGAILLAVLFVMSFFSHYLVGDSKSGLAALALFDLAAIWWLFGPYIKVATKRIVIAPEFLQSWNHDETTLLEMRRPPEGKGSELKVVRYTGKCPKCGGKIRIASGGICFLGRIVGRCVNAPSEHVYSFDHVTRTGKPLR